jgi:hypothetical protein
VWGDHPEGGEGNGMIADSASDKKAREITWLTNTTGRTHYDNYNDMYIAQQVRVRDFRKANANKRKAEKKKKEKTSTTRNTSAVSSEPLRIYQLCGFQ